VHSGSFAPAFTLSFHDSECSRKPPNAHSLGRYQQAEKKGKNRTFTNAIKKTHKELSLFYYKTFHSK